MSRRQGSPKDVKSWRDIPDRQITEAWGGFRNFMHSYGLKMYNIEDVEEAHAILDAFKKHEFEEVYASKGGGSASAGTSTRPNTQENQTTGKKNSRR